MKLMVIHYVQYTPKLNDASKLDQSSPHSASHLTYVQ